MCDAENCVTALATQPVLSVPVCPIEEELHLQEKLYPILLQHNEMRSLADLDEPLVRATRKLVGERLRPYPPLPPRWQPRCEPLRRHERVPRLLPAHLPQRHPGATN